MPRLIFPDQGTYEGALEHPDVDQLTANLTRLAFLADQQKQLKDEYDKLRDWCTQHLSGDVVIEYDTGEQLKAEYRATTTRTYNGDMAAQLLQGPLKDRCLAVKYEVDKDAFESAYDAGLITDGIRDAVVTEKRNAPHFRFVPVKDAEANDAA